MPLQGSVLSLWKNDTNYPTNIPTRLPSIIPTKIPSQKPPSTPTEITSISSKAQTLNSIKAKAIMNVVLIINTFKNEITNKVTILDIIILLLKSIQLPIETSLILNTLYNLNNGYCLNDTYLDKSTTSATTTTIC